MAELPLSGRAPPRARPAREARDAPPRGRLRRRLVNGALALFLSVATGLVGAAIVHILVVLLVPRVADNNAWGRLSRLGELFEAVRVPALGAETAAAGTPPPAGAGAVPGMPSGFAFIDPAFVTASCRFSLADGPVRIYADAETEFWTASIYDRAGDNLYSINSRSAVDGLLDLLVGTPEQIVEARADTNEENDAAIPVSVGPSEGYLTLRALVGEESERPTVDAFVEAVVCEPAAQAAVPAAGQG